MNASTFSIVLPSNTKYQGAENEYENRPNKFKIVLPRKLTFENGTWLCGLQSIVYPNRFIHKIYRLYNYIFSWPAIGSNESQWMDVVLKNGEKYRYPIPPGSYLTPQDLENGLHMDMKAKLEKQYSTGITAPSELVKPKRSTSNSALEAPKTKSFKGPPENVQTDFRIEFNPRIPETIQVTPLPYRQPVIKAATNKTGIITPADDGDQKLPKIPPRFEAQSFEA